MISFSSYIPTLVVVLKQVLATFFTLKLKRESSKVTLHHLLFLSCSNGLFDEKCNDSATLWNKNISKKVDLKIIANMTKKLQKIGHPDDDAIFLEWPH